MAIDSRLSVALTIPVMRKPKPKPRKVKSGLPTPVYLAIWRDHLRVKQDELAERIGVTAATISRWENEERRIALEDLHAYAKGLKIPVIWLFRRPSERPSIDAMIAEEPDEVKDMATEIVETIIKRGGQK